VALLGLPAWHFVGVYLWEEGAARRSRHDGVANTPYAATDSLFSKAKDTPRDYKSKHFEQRLLKVIFLVHCCFIFM
jgi:hypothetical protein